jgi:hypothetical protein
MRRMIIDEIEIRFDGERDPLWADALKGDLNHPASANDLTAYLDDVEAFAQQELNQANVYRREQERNEFTTCSITILLDDGTEHEGYVEVKP